MPLLAPVRKTILGKEFMAYKVPRGRGSIPYDEQEAPERVPPLVLDHPDMPAGSQRGEGQLQPTGVFRLGELLVNLAPSGIEEADVHRSGPIGRNPQSEGRVARPMESEDVHLGQVGGGGRGGEAGNQIIAQDREDILLDRVVRAGWTLSLIHI